VTLASASGVRSVPLERFFLGYMQIDLRPDEIISSVRVPVPPEGSRASYRKLGTRKAQSIAKVSVAGYAELTDRIDRIALAAGSVAPTTIALTQVAQRLAGRRLSPELMDGAAQQAMKLVRPITDVRSTAAYRREMVGVLVRRFLESLLPISSRPVLSRGPG
jgi:CO/xanthine dehydrogenase FAD-binding subunit